MTFIIVVHQEKFYIIYKLVNATLSVLRRMRAYEIV